MQPPPLQRNQSADAAPLFSLPPRSAGGAAAFVLCPEQYEIVLVVDNREKGRKDDRGLIPQKLISMGVDVVVRPLPLGDFIWIARERTTPIPGQLSLPVQRELVLDYVAERKRMDDLVSCGDTEGRGSIVTNSFCLSTCRHLVSWIRVSLNKKTGSNLQKLSIQFTSWRIMGTLKDSAWMQSDFIRLW
jgi:hypothetical protein